MRQIADCRRFESEKNCTLTIIGEEGEVVETAAQHAVAAHGHADSSELRDMIRSTLEPEESYISGQRTPEPFPG